MKQRGEWGEFIATKHSPWAYNESVGFEYFPLTKDECAKMGVRWEDEQSGSHGKETLASENIPESIDAVSDLLTKEVLACVSCGMNYKILKKELERLKNIHLPIPLHCQDCRFTKRFERHIVPVLYHRSCMCTENHPFHAGSVCPTELETTYTPPQSTGAGYRPEEKDIVYCKPCYQECVQ